MPEWGVEGLMDVLVVYYNFSTFLALACRCCYSIKHIEVTLGIKSFWLARTFHFLGNFSFWVQCNKIWLVELFKVWGCLWPIRQSWSSDLNRVSDTVEIHQEFQPVFIYAVSVFRTILVFLIVLMMLVILGALVAHDSWWNFYTKRSDSASITNHPGRLRCFCSFRCSVQSYISKYQDISGYLIIFLHDYVVVQNAFMSEFFK